MAAAEAVTTKDDSKVKEDDMPVIVTPTGWSRAQGSSIDSLIEAMNGVKDQFVERSKELFGYNFKEYEATKTGLVMFLMGGQNFVGLVKLSNGFYASIRVHHTVGTLGQMPFELEGFCIDSKASFHYVKSGEFSDNLFDGWTHVQGKESIDSMKGALLSKGVKEEFIKKAKEICGMAFDEYNVTDIGYRLVNNYGIYYIVLIKLGKSNNLGGFYASIRSFQIDSQNPPLIGEPFLQGFSIDSRSFIHFVQSGQYGAIVNESTVKSVNLKDIVKSEKDELLFGQNKIECAIGNGYFGFDHIVYTGTGYAQTLVNKMKDEIKKKAGITRELSSFVVVTAAVQNTGLREIANFYVKIFTGIDPWTQFQEYIYVSLTNSVWLVQDGKYDQTITINSANVFPL